MKVLKFYAPTCMPCKMIGKMLDSLENVEVIPIDATEDLAKVDEYEVCNTPTLIFLNENNEEVDRIAGMTTLKKIEEVLNKEC